MPEGNTARALAAALESLERTGPRAVAKRENTGWSITVAENGTVHAYIPLPHWHEFRPASAGHRLIEHGWTVHTSAFSDRARMAGWIDQASGAYVAPVARDDALLRQVCAHEATAEITTEGSETPVLVVCIGCGTTLAASAPETAPEES